MRNIGCSHAISCLTDAHLSSTRQHLRFKHTELYIFALSQIAPRFPLPKHLPSDIVMPLSIQPVARRRAVNTTEPFASSGSVRGLDAMAVSSPDLTSHQGSAPPNFVQVYPGRPTHPPRWTLSSTSTRSPAAPSGFAFPTRETENFSNSAFARHKNSTSLPHCRFEFRSLSRVSILCTYS